MIFAASFVVGFTAVILTMLFFDWRRHKQRTRRLAQIHHGFKKCRWEMRNGHRDEALYWLAKTEAERKEFWSKVGLSN